MGCKQTTVLDPQLDAKQHEKNFVMQMEIHHLKADLYGKTITNVSFACDPVLYSLAGKCTMYKGIKKLRITQDMNFDWNVLPVFFQLNELIIDVPLTDYLSILIGDNFLESPFICPSVREVYFLHAIHYTDDFSFLTECFPNLRKIGVHADHMSDKLKAFCEQRQLPILLYYINYDEYDHDYKFRSN